MGRKRITKKFPFMPVRDVVVFPYTAIPLDVGRKESLNSVRESLETGRLLVIFAQKEAFNDKPGLHDVYPVGVLVNVLQVINLPGGSRKVLVEGVRRAHLACLYEKNGYWEAEVSFQEEVNQVKDPAAVKALVRSVSELFDRYAELDNTNDPGTLQEIEEVSDPGQLSDMVAGNLRIKKPEAQKLLEESDSLKRLETVSLILRKEIEILKIQREIEKKAVGQIERAQKEYYLTEQLKAINKELNGPESQTDEIKELEAMIAGAGMSREVAEQASRELGRMKKMMPFSPEATVSRTYIDWLIKLPWKKTTEDRINPVESRVILEAEHYGLEEAKERVLEFLAVSKLSGGLRAPILCFTGPPGTGKTSFGRSIARALGREFTRFSLGGIRDEAEIRGHRRTYIGSMPGRIIQSIARAGTRNPVFLLDEIDKIGKDFRGDPSSALLEALDPEQNSSFSDNYLEVPFDLSGVVFITTANSIAGMPPAIIDRMEIVSFPGYTRDEKFNIAKKFLIPKQIKENGLLGRGVTLTDAAVRYISDNYTREAGVRNLEKEIAKVLRKTAADIASGGVGPRRLSVKAVRGLLGIEKFSQGGACHNGVGIAAGLSLSASGGETLSIEVSLMPGTGVLHLTGALGEIMKESAQTAVSFVRANSRELGVPSDFYRNNDIHVHVPAGGVPKEGPSAGITICTALVSRLKNIPVRKGVAMTGELTLSGNVLPIGGFREKLLAAHRDRFRTVLVPEENRRNIVEIPENIKSGINLVTVKNFKEVVEHAF